MSKNEYENAGMPISDEQLDQIAGGDFYQVVWWILKMGIRIMTEGHDSGFGGAKRSW